MKDIKLEDLINIPTALLLRALKSKKEMENKTAAELVEMIEESVALGRAEADSYLESSKESGGKVE